MQISMARHSAAVWQSFLIILLLVSFKNQNGVYALDPLGSFALTGMKFSNEFHHQLAGSDPNEIYEAYTLDTPVDHFHNDSKYEPHSNGTFPLRYWFDASYYRWGGPVILLLAGEANATFRLPTLQKGIIHRLIKATNGIGVLLEHRYYGESQPMPDLSVQNLRFLDTQQAMADTAYFARNVRFPGLEWLNLDPEHTAWIVYGGSYAGAFSAILRVLYPQSFWGAISSSSVPSAIVDYWQYWEAIRLYGPSECISKAQRFMEFVDGILLLDPVTTPQRSKLVQSLKNIFGLSHLSSDLDFANVVSRTQGLESWQSRNWDPEISNPGFGYWCSNMSSSEVLYPETEEKRFEIENLMEDIPGTGYIDPVLVNITLNWIGYLGQTSFLKCKNQGYPVEACFQMNETFWQQEDLGQAEWRSWTWQVCSQWGYLTGGSSTPLPIRPLVSRLLTTEYDARPCLVAFNRTIKDIDIESINQYGGLGIGMDTPRLALIDGQADPWLYAGPHAPTAPKRMDGVTSPWVELEGAVHHWDENALFDNETSKTVPENIQQCHAWEEIFVKTWVDEYNVRCRRYRECGF